MSARAGSDPDRVFTRSRKPVAGVLSSASVTMSGFLPRLEERPS